MAETITTTVQLQEVIESKIALAVEDVAKQMTEELKSYIQEDFYNQYSPKFYDRTYSFLNSGTYRMLSNDSAEIFVNTDVMHYLCEDYGISGEDIAVMGSLGYHGSYDIFREGYYWQDFLDWANQNVSKLIKSALISQGLEII